MALTIVELYEALKRLDETGLLDSVDGEVVVAYQPNYPPGGRGDRLRLHRQGRRGLVEDVLGGEGA